MKNTQKGFIAPLLAGIIVLLIAGGGAYLYMEKKQTDWLAKWDAVFNKATSTAPVSNPQTTEWNTYTNDVIGFQFQYPSTWAPPLESLISSNNPDSSYTVTIGTLSINTWVSPMTIDELLVSKDGYKREVVFVDGKKGVKTIFPASGGGKVNDNTINAAGIRIPLSNNKIFSVSFTPADDAVYNQIISTLKFTSPAQVPVSPVTEQVYNPKGIKFSANPTLGLFPMSVWFSATLPDGTKDNLIYSVDFGDGYTYTMEWNNGKGMYDSWVASVFHKYIAPGIYTASLKTVPNPPCPTGEANRLSCDPVTVDKLIIKVIAP